MALVWIKLNMKHVKEGMAARIVGVDPSKNNEKTWQEGTIVTVYPPVPVVTKTGKTKKVMGSIIFEGFNGGSYHIHDSEKTRETTQILVEFNTGSAVVI